MTKTNFNFLNRLSIFAQQKIRNSFSLLLFREILDLADIRYQRIFSLINEGKIKITTEIPELWSEQKLIATKLKINNKDLLDRITDPLGEEESEKRLEETMIGFLEKDEFNIDQNEHIIAVFDKAVEHLLHLDRDKFKDKVKDIRKKTKRVIHQL